jgi:hypothetical protein
VGYADFLTQSAAVSSRSARPRSGFGEDKAQFTAVAGKGTLPCLVQPTRPETLAKQGRDASQLWVSIHFAVDPGVTNDDIITVDGQVYAVKGQLDFNSMHECYRVDCVQMRT